MFTFVEQVSWCKSSEEDVDLAQGCSDLEDWLPASAHHEPDKVFLDITSIQPAASPHPAAQVRVIACLISASLAALALVFVMPLLGTGTGTYTLPRLGPRSLRRLGGTLRTSRPIDRLP